MHTGVLLDLKRKKSKIIEYVIAVLLIIDLQMCCEDRFPKERLIMFKRITAALVCGAVTIGCMCGCGEAQEKINSVTAGNNAAADAVQITSEPCTEAQSPQNVPVMNFTAPQIGEQIIILNIRDCGEVRFRLFPEYAGEGVENFIALASQGYYDGLTFHRVISDFMIQGGDPLGDGTGGESVWGGKFEGGCDPHLIHAAGAVAYANNGSTSTNGSQFYIVTGDVYDSSSLAQMMAYYGMTLGEQAQKLYSTIGGAPWLDGSYTIFGQVYQGLDIFFGLQYAETDPDTDTPLESIIIDSVTVAEYSGEELDWYISDQM